MPTRFGRQVLVTSLAVFGFGVALLYAPAADTAPGDLADLAVNKADSPDPAFVGSPLTYTIEVTNLGLQGATGVTLTDRLPKQVDFVSATPSNGDCDLKKRVVTCDLGNLAADLTGANAVTVTIVVRPTKAGTISNTASIDSIEKDPVGVNDKDETPTTVNDLAQAPTCRGTTATIVGTSGPDRLTGGGGRDVIVALGGDDRVIAYAGRDLVCSGGGNDVVGAGTADDRVFAGAGSDRVHGRGGRDLLAGNGGRDLLAGGGSADRLRGGRGFDRCYGGAGFDVERGCER
jgi:uncharacterized repeat protein (TIGR01451 family)